MTPPRYLTPAKICLLLLIDLYNADYVQGPSRLDLLSFVYSHIHGPSETNQHGQLSPESRLTSSMTSIESALSSIPSGTSERSIYDLLLHCLWRLTDLDSFFTLFLSGEDLVAPSSSDSSEKAATKISRSSPIGQFVRRCCVEFTRLQFSDAQSLWKSLCVYRASSYEVWAAQSPEAAAALPSSAWPDAGSQADQEGDFSASADDTSLLLSQSISHLQKLGTRLPSSLKAQLAAWSGSLSESNLQHFLAFFEHWRAGAYTMALEALHRYFDYCLIGQQDLAGGVSGAAGPGQGGWMKMSYQYALLHLSVLHADFERWEESMEALGECVATARENQDPTCLSFALSYLLFLRQSHPQPSHFSFTSLTRLIGGGNGNGSEQDEITFLKAKAREGRHWNLLASTLLEQARGEMYSGGNVSKSLECILQSEYLCVQHDLRNMTPAAALFRGASLDRLGQTCLSTQTYENIGIAHDVHCPLPDSVRASCRLAHDLACAGRFDRALKLLSTVKDTAAKGILKLEHRVLIFEMLVLLRKNIHAESFEAADVYLEQLRPARAFAESEVTHEITMLEIELLRKKHDYQTALAVLNGAIQRLKSTTKADLAHNLRLLNAKAHVFACAGQPLKGLSIALRAAASAERHLLISVLVEAIAVLGPILMELRKYGAAKDILGAAAPMAIEGRQVAVTARLLLVFAQANVGYAGHECKMGSSEQLDAVQEAKRIAEKSLQAYSQVNDHSGMRECLTLTAKVAQWEGDGDMVRRVDAQLEQLAADPT